MARRGSGLHGFLNEDVPVSNRTVRTGRDARARLVTRRSDVKAAELAVAPDAAPPRLRSSSSGHAPRR